MKIGSYEIDWVVCEDNKNYEVNRFGDVRGIRKKRILAQGLRAKGYKFVELYMTKERKKKYFVHRLIAKAFIPNPENKPHINHINGIKDDNRIENLEWCTPAENLIHAYENGFNRRYNRPVNQYSLDGKFLKQWKSATEASNELKISRPNLCALCNYNVHKRGKFRQIAGGFRWEFVERRRGRRNYYSQNPPQ